MASSATVRTERGDWIFLCGCGALFIAVLWACGWTRPWESPDSASYLDVAPYPDFFFQVRLPFYGWLARLVGTASMLWLHLLLHVAAAAALFIGVRRLVIGRAVVLALFLPALLSQSFVIYGRGLVPDAPAESLLVLALAATLMLAAEGGSLRHALAAGLSAAGTILLRPAFAPLLLALPLVWIAACRIAARPLRVPPLATLLLAMLVPLALYAGERARHTGDVKLVAFAGFQMSGMAGLMLTEEIVSRFPDDSRELAAQILAARTRAEADGRVIATRRNSAGERSFPSAAIGYFDIFASSHEDLLYGEIIKLQKTGEAWTEFDARLQRFALATFSLAPVSYAAWVAGAAARMVGRMTVTNLPFVLAMLALVLALCRLMWRPSAIERLQGAPDTVLTVAVVAGYVLATAPLAVLMTFPAARYIDAAAALLPALPLYAALRIAGAARTT